MISVIRSIYRREQFSPGWIGVFVNPFYIARRGLAEAIRKYSGLFAGRLLDVGCGTKPYKKLFAVQVYEGLDIDSPIVRKNAVADRVYDGNAFPYASESYDSVICNQVLEHVFTPDQFLSEIRRVMVPGGKLLLTVPFVWDEHEIPYDYCRYSSFGLRALLEKNGFSIIHHEKICPDASVLCQLLNVYVYKVSQHWPVWARVFLALVVFAPVTCVGILIKRIFPDNLDLFLDQIVVAEKTQ